ncbi:putative ABC transporter permease [uncultured Clostridium sp.]|uniref:putative ABC transporter permease n=1 Tax=uncultured Clostridium sp. TaxID=59620 RepID=UPI0028EDB459|nr:putative ABC transporter permease [uncultured Clostridium sp.]
MFHYTENLFYYYFAYFIAFSMLGWCLEVIYHLYTDKRFINRGFLHGPVCPIYGSAAVTLILTLEPLGNKIWLIFLGGAAVATILEYFTGWILELLFNTKWWDYSKESFNIKGYICLKFSLIWGGMSIIFIKLLYPRVKQMMLSIPAPWSEILYNVSLILFVIDATITIAKLFDFKKQFSELQLISKEIKSNLALLKNKALDSRKLEEINHRTEYLKERYQQLIIMAREKHYHFINAYPRLSSKKFGNVLEELKEIIRARL